MNHLIENIVAIGPVWAAFIATTFTWFLTASGAAIVFLFKDMSRKTLDGMLGLRMRGISRNCGRPFSPSFRQKSQGLEDRKMDDSLRFSSYN